MKKIIVLVLSLVSLNCYSLNKLTGDKWDHYLWVLDSFNNYGLDNSYIVIKNIDPETNLLNYAVIDNLIEKANKKTDIEDALFYTSEYCNKLTSN